MQSRKETGPINQLFLKVRAFCIIQTGFSCPVHPNLKSGLQAGHMGPSPKIILFHVLWNRHSAKYVAASAQEVLPTHHLADT